MSTGTSVVVAGRSGSDERPASRFGALVREPTSGVKWADSGGWGLAGTCWAGPEQCRELMALLGTKWGSVSDQRGDARVELRKRREHG
ncbi:hypothetical protein ACIRG5_42560 [Lentzea sp. NPDC102401]|uniref:hypothetical protein n=1 Tax=Lentzea sp. NPDC102401 TaxID=3364128 RepID=UPI003816A422